MAHYDNKPDSRTTSPSFSERVRSLTRARFSSASRSTLVDDPDLESETNAGDESDQGLTPVQSRSAPVKYGGDYISDRLQPSKALNDRINMLKLIAQNAAEYPIPVLMSIWRSTGDLYREEAQPEARIACFNLATAIAKQRDISTEILQQLYDVVARQAPIEVLEDQVKSLKAITLKGARTVPFSPQIGKFLTASLGRQFTLATEARKRNKNANHRDDMGKTRENGLSSLFNLIANIESQNPGAIQSQDQSVLLEELFAVAEKTSYGRDMKNVVTVLSPIIKASGVPETQRVHCVELLCAISNAVDTVRDETKASLFFMLRSDYRQHTVKILLDTLSLALSDRHTSIVCGALAILLELIKNKGQNDLPVVTFGQFIEPFSLVHYGSRATRSACLQTISDLLTDPYLQDDILASDWTYMIDTILTATGDEIYEPGNQNQPLSIESKDKSKPISSTSGQELHKDQSKQKRLAASILEHLEKIASSFNSFWPLLDTKQRQLVARFYSELINVLPPDNILHLVDSTIQAVESAMTDPNGMSKSAMEPPAAARANYYECFDQLIDMFLLNQRIPPSAYRRIMQGIRADLELAGKENNDTRLNKFTGYVHRLLTEFENIQGGGWQRAVELAQTIAVAWKLSVPDHFAKELDLLTALLHSKADEEDLEALRDTDAGDLYLAQHGMAKVTLALVDVFLHYLPDYTETTTLLFNKFIQISADRALSPSVRLPALRLLARIRCDQKHSIFITTDADSLGLAFSLRRTEESRHQLATFQQENPRLNSPGSASVSSDGTRELRRSRKSLDNLSRPSRKPPLWMYPGGPGLPSEPPRYPSSTVSVHIKEPNESGTFKINEWLLTAMEILQNETEWEVYSYVVVHLPSQLCNSSLFAGSIAGIKMLRSIIVGQLLDTKFLEPPADTHVKKGDVAFCLMQSILILLGYAEHFSQNEQDDMVKVIVHGIGTWERTAQICVQALTVASHAIPLSITKTMPAILGKLERYITQMNLTVDILEFLGVVARSRPIHASLVEDEHRKVFAICTKYLEYAREHRSRLTLSSGASRDYTSSARWSGASTASTFATEAKDQDNQHKDLPQYVFVLTYHIITIWFLAIKLADRHKHIAWISKNLAWRDSHGVERMEEQSQVTLDMMLRAAYSDLGETRRAIEFKETDGPVMKKLWLVGLSIFTIETAAKTGLTQITKRQISGTTHAMYQQQTAHTAAHHVWTEEVDVNVLPHHVFLQLTTSIAPTPPPMEPVCLPDDAIVDRAIRAFDRMDTVDGYGIGVLYVKDGHSQEKEILANTTNSTHFKRFMEQLGTKVELKNASFNTQGLDTVSDADGQHVYAWRDRLIEMIYHAPVMMPTMEDDPQCISKKKHIGNDFVTIVWNESGFPFRFDTIPSAFNSVNIVITPENSMAPSSETNDDYVVSKEDESADKDDPRYTVQTITHPTFPRLSACASAKLLPLSALPALVRQIALSSAIFSNVWRHREDGEYVSSWRNRLREIIKLRERYAAGGEGSGARKDRAYAQGDSFEGRVEMGGITEEKGILPSLDFSRWAGDVPMLGSESQGRR